jgi:hypothetical protein
VQWPRDIVAGSALALALGCTVNLVARRPLADARGWEAGGSPAREAAVRPARDILAVDVRVNPGMPVAIASIVASTDFPAASVSELSGEEPRQVGGLPTAVAVAAGGDRTCIIAEDRTVWCWGSWTVADANHDRAVNEPSPVRVAWTSGATEIAVGDGFACALSVDGRVRCEGIAAPRVGGIEHVDASGWDACVTLRGSGAVRCRGGNVVESEPVVDAEPSAQPDWQQVPGLYGVARLWLGGQSRAAMRDGTVRWWGRTNACWGVPRWIPETLAIYGATDVGADCAILSKDGMLRCWSYTGDSSPTLTPPAYLPPPTSIPLAHVTQLAQGADLTCAVHDEGHVSCWGANIDGVMGDPDVKGTELPMPMAAWGDDVRRIVFGAHHACALTKDGTVLCAGKNDHDQLGPPLGEE